MKYENLSIILIIVSLFIGTQIFGLYIADNYFVEELPFGLEPPEIEETESPWYLFAVVLVMTGILLALLKLKWNKLIKIWFLFAFIICASVTLNVFVGAVIAVIIAITLFIIKYMEKDLIMHNMTEILVYVGLPVLLTPIFNLTSIIILLLLISVYDFVSVFLTKHMIALAKAQQKMGLFAGLVIKRGKEAAVLGGGDIVFPLMFASILLRDFNIYYAISSILLSSIGLLTIIFLGQKKKFYPAMPFITGGCFLTLILLYFKIF